MDLKHLIPFHSYGLDPRGGFPCLSSELPQLRAADFVCLLINSAIS